MAIENQIKTVVLLGALTGILLWIGSLWGQSGLMFALFFSVLMNAGSYWFSDKIALAMYRAKESKGEFPKIESMLTELATEAKLPKPKLYIIRAPYANAFATGRNPAHASVAVTTGIIDLLTQDELRGVLAHEVAHIKNRDILISSVAATIAGVISYIAMMARWGAMFGGMNRDQDGGSALELLVLAILTPILATIIQLAISRSREYVADETGAKLCHSPMSLANALDKLENGKSDASLRMNSQTQATAHMFITNPFRGSSFLHLFMTHPPTKERIKRLQKL